MNLERSLFIFYHIYIDFTIHKNLPIVFLEFIRINHACTRIHIENRAI